MRFKEFKRRFIARENRGGSAKLRAHIRDSRAFGNGKRLHALTRVLHNLAHAALNGQAAEDFKYNVLGGHPVVELAREIYLDYLRHRYVISTAAHCYRDIKTARAHCQHTDTAARGCMTVRTDQRFAGLSETLQMNLMADTVAGAREPDTVLFCHRTDKTVVVRVFEAALQGVVIDVCNRALRFNAVYAHCLKLQICHGSRCVLREGLVDTKSYFRALCHLAVNDMRLDDFFR